MPRWGPISFVSFNEPIDSKFQKFIERIQML